MAHLTSLEASGSVLGTHKSKISSAGKKPILALIVTIQMCQEHLRREWLEWNRNSGALSSKWERGE